MHCTALLSAINSHQNLQMLVLQLACKQSQTPQMYMSSRRNEKLCSAWQDPFHEQKMQQNCNSILLNPEQRKESHQSHVKIAPAPLCYFPFSCLCCPLHWCFCSFLQSCHRQCKAASKKWLGKQKPGWDFQLNAMLKSKMPISIQRKDKPCNWELLWLSCKWWRSKLIPAFHWMRLELTMESKFVTPRHGSNWQMQDANKWEILLPENGFQMIASVAGMVSSSSSRCRRVLKLDVLKVYIALNKTVLALVMWH